MTTDNRGLKYKHQDGTMWILVGTFGAWLKLVPLQKQDAPPIHVGPEFMRYWTALDLH